MANDVRYGHIRGGEQGAPAVLVASTAVLATSAKFVKRTGASTNTVSLISAVADSEVLGWLECEEFPLKDESDGTEVRKVISDPTAIFRCPISPDSTATFYGYMRGKAADIDPLSAGMQYIFIDSATYGQVIIVDGDTVDSKWVDVRINNSVVKNVGVV